MANFTWPSVSVSSAPIQFVQDGSPETVNQDTVTPAASKPLPVIALDASGVPVPVFDPTNIETLLTNIEADTTSILADTNTLAAVDYATETTLQSVLADTNTLAAVDFATLTEQQTQTSHLDDISEQQLSVIDPTNSSVTPLGIGGVFTGSAVEITNFCSISIAAFSDVDSAAGGLSMQFSPDGTNWDHKHNFTVTGGIGVSYNQSAELRYFRIVYTNGAVAQTTFRLTVVLKRYNTTPSKYSLEQSVSGAMMADLTKSVIWGLSSSGGGTYHTVKVKPSGSLTVDATGSTVAATQSGTWNITNVSGTVSLPTGASTLAEQQTQSSTLTTIANKDFATQTTLSAMSAKLPTTLGQTTKSGSLSVTVASDQVLDVKQTGRAKIEQAYLDYTLSNVTTSAYTELIASTTATASRIEIFDSSGELMILAVGASSSEVDQLFIFPGGNGAIDLAIPASSRISVKAKTATASEGYLAINLYA